MMEVGKRYVVTKASDDGTFEVGDHVSLHTDGSIMCREAMGWIESIDAREASKGMEVELDREWIEARKRKLRKELVEMEGISNAD